MFVLDELRGRLRRTDRAHVFQHALSLDKFLLDELRDGKQIVLRDRDGTEKVVDILTPA